MNPQQIQNLACDIIAGLQDKGLMPLKRDSTELVECVIEILNYELLNEDED